MRPPRTLRGWSPTHLAILAATILFFSDPVSTSLKLNMARIRIPFSETTRVNVTLVVESSDGCFRWSVTPPDILSITPMIDGEDPECSHSATVSTIPKGVSHTASSLPLNAIVRVEDTNTQEFVRCGVTIDKIAYLTIQTAAKELHHEDGPFKIFIQAFGPRGELFDSLEGLPFKWSIEGGGGWSSIIEGMYVEPIWYLPFRESNYSISEKIVALEALGQQGSMILVAGLEPGISRIFAKLLDPLYESLATSYVKIYVVANLILDPYEAVVVPEAQFKLKLFQIKQGKPVEISLQSREYDFKITNESVAVYDPKSATITALAIGDTKITVQDKNFVDETESQHPAGPSAFLSVRDPKFLSLGIYPHGNWAVIIGEPYEIVVEVFDGDNQKILITDNIQVKTTFSNEAFKLNTSSVNQTWHFGLPAKVGTTLIKAELPLLFKLDGTTRPLSPPPTVKAEMELYQRIVVKPTETRLPWDPIVKPKYDIQMSPSGGTGTYHWSTTNSSIVTVNPSGKGKSDGYGLVNVTAAMTANAHNRGICKIYILPPMDMAIIEHIVEAEVGTHILVPLAFYMIRPDDPEKIKVPFSYCKTMPYKVEVDNPAFIYDEKAYYPATKPACALIPILSQELGSSLVRVKYQLDEKTFEASALVSTFKPLKISEPKSLETVLAVGSSRNLIFEGGPRPLHVKHEGFKREFFVQNTTVLRHTELRPSKAFSGDDIYTYEVLCTEIGETKVGIDIGNEASSPERLGVSRRAVVNVICAEPASLYFRIETTASASKCPHDLAGGEMSIAVSNYEESRILVTVKDSKGRLFDNVTSLTIEWAMDKESLLEFGNTKWVATEGIEAEHVGNHIPGKHIQRIKPSGQSGAVEITGNIVGYRNDLLNRLGIKYLILEKPIADKEKEYSEAMSHSMELQLVSELACDPPSPVSIFNHQSSKMLVNEDQEIPKGRGFPLVQTDGEIVIGDLEGTFQNVVLIQKKSKICITTQLKLLSCFKSFFSKRVALPIQILNSKLELCPGTGWINFSLFNFRYPGTNYCGPNSPSELQPKPTTSLDTCCKQHDDCAGFEGPQINGFINPGLFTISKCSCDDIFKDCLHANILEHKDRHSSIIGNLYFNLARMYCFQIFDGCILRNRIIIDRELCLVNGFKNRMQSFILQAENRRFEDRRPVQNYFYSPRLRFFKF